MEILCARQSAARRRNELLLILLLLIDRAPSGQRAVRLLLLQRIRRRNVIEYGQRRGALDRAALLVELHGVERRQVRRRAAQLLHELLRSTSNALPELLEGATSAKLAVLLRSGRLRTTHGLAVRLVRDSQLTEDVQRSLQCVARVLRVSRRP